MVSELLSANMSVDGTKLLFEGFLQKRKDTLKMRWVTYWFRLQNSTLFFYSEKNGSASHLRGYYYIYTVQSVREVKKADGKHFMFEIIMINGKRKMLAAETAALREEWVRQLWKAMHLSSSGLWNSNLKQPEECEQRDRINSSTPFCFQTDSVMELLPARPLSAPPPSNHIYNETKIIPLSAPPPSNHIYNETKIIPFPLPPSEGQDSEEATYQNIFLCSNDQSPNDQSVSDPQSSSGVDNDEHEGEYDVLPCRKDIRALDTSAEGIYDCPRSYRSSAEHQDPTESIYDVPSCLLRAVDDQTTDKQSEEEIYWRI